MTTTTTDINFEYFYITFLDGLLTITPKEIIMDIICDYSQTIIPFSNGKTYFVYQELTFHIIDFLETLGFDFNVRLYPLSKVISIEINKDKDNEETINKIKQFTTDYINKKFCLL